MVEAATINGLQIGENVGGVDATRPEYDDMYPEWEMVRLSVRGESAVKERTEEFLPIPSAFSAAGAPVGQYEAYILRAEFPELTEQTLTGMSGVVTRKPLKVEMPEGMQSLHERATDMGLPLEVLYRDIVRELIETGRCELLADTASAPPIGGTMPWLVFYKTEQLINWSDEGDFYVLDESRLVRDGFTWEWEQKYRVLSFEGGQYTVEVFVAEGTTETHIVSTTEKSEDTLFTRQEVAAPQMQGSKQFEEIPLAVISARGLTLDLDKPPILGVARACMSMYQLSADYRWQLFMAGQETFVAINADAPTAVGAGIRVSLKGEPGAGNVDAKYVGPSGIGIEKHRVAIQDARDQALAAGARLFDASQRAAESGEALKLRYTAQTATLVSIAQAAASGLERALRYIARMIGADPETVVVTADLAFLNKVMNATDAAALVKMWADGAISYETLYENLVRGEIANEEREAEDELALIDKEQEDMEPEVDPAMAGLLPPPDPNNPNDPRNQNPPPNNQLAEAA